MTVVLATTIYTLNAGRPSPTKHGCRDDDILASAGLCIADMRDAFVSLRQRAASPTSTAYFTNKACCRQQRHGMDRTFNAHALPCESGDRRIGH